MPIINKNDRGNWYNSIPVEGADRRFRPDPDTFDINKLQENEIDYGNGTVMAKIPVIPGHIYKRSSENRINTYIELVLGRTFDKEKNQGRNKKVIIGTDASGLFPGMMVINDHYREYFDRNGRIIHEELKRTLAEEARQKEEKKQKREAAKREKQKQAMEQKIAERPYGIDYASLTDREWTALGDVLEEALTQDETAVSETAKTETEEGKNGTVRDDLTETEEKNPNTTAKKEAKRTVKEIQQSIEEKEKELIRKLEETDRLRKELDHIQTVKKVQFEEAVRDHIQLLRSIFSSHYSNVREQSKRHNSEIMTPKEVRTANALLSEIKEYFKGSETEDYLQLAEEPVVDRDGEIIAGTTYGEMSMLMSAYHWTLAAHAMNMLNEKFDMPGRKKTDTGTNTTEEKEETP